MTKKKPAPNAFDLIERNAHILSTAADHVGRRLYIFGDIDDATAFRTIAALNLMDTQTGPITLFINTPGGAIESGFAIFDAIKLTRNPVTIVGMGSVMSMGAIIMQAADTRLMTRRARYMIHTGIYDAPGNWDTDKMIGMGREMDGIRKTFIEVLSERSRCSPEQILQFLLTETFFSAEEAIAHGFIDGILGASK